VIKQQDAARAEQLLRAYLDAAPDNSELPPAPPPANGSDGCTNESTSWTAPRTIPGALALDPRNKTLREELKRVEKK